jgi:hypothetical protein
MQLCKVVRATGARSTPIYRFISMLQRALKCLWLQQLIMVPGTLGAALQRRPVHMASLSRLAPLVARRTSRSVIQADTGSLSSFVCFTCLLSTCICRQHAS